MYRLSPPVCTYKTCKQICAKNILVSGKNPHKFPSPNPLKKSVKFVLTRFPAATEKGREYYRQTKALTDSCNSFGEVRDQT
jgi:hypothetical protein